MSQIVTSLTRHSWVQTFSGSVALAGGLILLEHRDLEYERYLTLPLDF